MKHNAKDQTGLSIISRRALQHISDIADGSVACGVGNTHIMEPVPAYNQAEVEEVISNKYNSFIVLGKDRSGSKLTGYGGMGDTQCAAIDIVTGRMGYQASQYINGQRQFVNPDFSKDAARIYISQKTDIDSNFKIVNGKVGLSIAKSGIALKADAIRIIGREGIKIVTGIDKENSQGGIRKSIYGIDLIAGNIDKDLQPLVKGNNVLDAIKKIIEYIDKLSGIIDSFLSSQMEFNAAVTTHFHPTNTGLTSPSPILLPMGTSTAVRQLAQTKYSLFMQKMSVAGFKFNYLMPSGFYYINSRYNNTN